MNTKLHRCLPTTKSVPIVHAYSIDIKYFPR